MKRAKKNKKRSLNWLLAFLVILLIIFILLFILICYNFIYNKIALNKEIENLTITKSGFNSYCESQNNCQSPFICVNNRCEKVEDSLDLKFSEKYFKIKSFPKLSGFFIKLDDSQDSLNLNDNVLIIYNSNAPESKEIAEYYADKRGINISRLCGIHIRLGQYANWSEFLGARKIIINECLCKIIPPEKFSAPCNIDNLDEIAKNSPITHMVIIKGIPPRLTSTPWEYDYEDPSLDFYLSLMLYNNLSYFDSMGWMNNDSRYYTESIQNNFNSSLQTERGTYGYVRDINVSLDRIVAYGRIEEITKNRTFDLINRTIDAENVGVSGNFLLGLEYNLLETMSEDSSDIYYFLRDLTSSNREECSDYLSNETNPWPYQTCRLGANRNGNIPGESHTNILRAINTGIYLGNNPWPNSQAGFDGFNNMLNWHKSEYDCITLCKDFTNPDEQESCRNNSKDYFKEINTECVGGSNGLIGWQFRSYPVQYFGFWPSNFGPSDSGSTDKTPPTVLSGDSYKDIVFTDDKYLHFGSLDRIENPNCTLENGQVFDCEEYIAINIENYNTNVSYVPGQSINYTLKLRHRNPSNIGKTLRIGILLYLSNGSLANYSYKFINLDQENLDWKTEELNFSFKNNFDKNIISVRTLFNSYINGPVNWFDLDGIELIDYNKNRIIDIDTGSFNNSFTGYTYSGDWASNIIARLNGIAWWGSSSHFLTGGVIFTKASDFAGAFYSGKSLGESLAYINRYGMSGIIYGDPLYRPSGVKIFMNKGLTPLNDKNNPYFISLGDESSIPQIYINAFHGQGNLDRTNWQLSVCQANNTEECDTYDRWEVFESGTNAVYNYPINTLIPNLLSQIQINKSFIIKLRVYNPGDEYNDLTNYAYFGYCSCDCPNISCNINTGCSYSGNCDSRICEYQPISEKNKDIRSGIECNTGIKAGIAMNNSIDYYCAGNIGECVECKYDSDCNSNPLNPTKYCHILNDNIGECRSTESAWSSEINTCDQLQMMQVNLREDYKLIRNIDFAKCNIKYLTGAGFIPIGNLENPFNGSFDGQGFSIINLYINDSENDYVGLFGYIDNSSITNLRIINSSITGKSYAGTIAGYFTGEINNSIVYSNVNGINSVGGIVGANIGKIANSFFNGKVNGTSYVGGLIGNNYGNVENCYSVSDVYGETIAGGLIGYNRGFTNTVQNSYSFCNVSGSFSLGGLIGSNTRIIKNSYSVCNVTGYTAGGLVYSSPISRIINSFYDEDYSICMNISEKCNNKIGNLSHIEIINSSYLSGLGWDFNNTWLSKGNDPYPQLRVFENLFFCGDEICDNDETCESCSYDCYCEEIQENQNPPYQGGSSSGGGGIIFQNKTNKSISNEEIKKTPITKIEEINKSKDNFFAQLGEIIKKQENKIFIYTILSLIIIILILILILILKIFKKYKYPQNN